MDADETYHTRTRLHVSAALAGTLRLEAARAHYLRHVLRLPIGARIAVFNAREGEFAARISAYAKGWVEIAVEARSRAPEVEGDIWLLASLIKRARFETIVEKATELGVGVIQPVIAARSNIDRVRSERLSLIATEAAEQSERLSVPEIRPPRRLAKILAGWPAGRGLIVCDETGGGGPIARVLAETRGPVALLTGPEGGFAPGEIDSLAKLAFVRRVGLGPRVLRADTAAIAALAILQALSDADAL
jgi:16S rRNA (uracil1498-N3)-methyltransferase